MKSAACYIVLAVVALMGLACAAQPAEAGCHGYGGAAFTYQVQPVVAYNSGYVAPVQVVQPYTQQAFHVAPVLAVSGGYHSANFAGQYHAQNVVAVQKVFAVRQPVVIREKVIVEKVVVRENRRQGVNQRPFRWR